MSIADGPTMSGRIDVVAPDQPVQPAAELQAAAERQYEADLALLAGYDRVGNPPESSNPDGSKTWQIDAGSSPDDARLSINEFSLPQIVIHAGDTVTWTNRSPGAVAHTVTASAPPTRSSGDLNPYQPVCIRRHRRTATAAAGKLPARHLEHLPRRGGELPHRGQPALGAIGHPYTGGPLTSGILLNQEYLDSPIGDGLPFASSYSVIFPNPGTYDYTCEIYPGMIGTVVVLPRAQVG